MRPIVVAGLSFVAMEAGAYGSHRWLMHGPAMGWHRSHHQPPTGRFERNDLFPACFALLAVAGFAAAAASDMLVSLRWIGIGVTAYGATYLFVHDVVIHGRVRLPLRDLAYFRWVRRAHRVHHLFGGEPYGMLLPFVPRPLRARAAACEREALDRSIREMRSRL